MIKTGSFVLLFHECDDLHYDLLLEDLTMEKLITFRVTEEQLKHITSGHECLLERIHDHQKKYLDYQGPLGKNRGSVTRIDCGKCSPITEDTYMIRGTILRGTLKMESRVSGYQTSATFNPEQNREAP